MILDTQYPAILKVLEEKKSFVICLSQTASIDAVASACALYLSLIKAGKQVSLVSEHPIKKEVEIIACEKVVNDLQGQGGDTLTMSFPYTEGAVDKVSYDIENDKFKLVVQPKPGFPKLDPKEVVFSYTGGKIDVVITVEVASLDALGKLYQDNQDKLVGVDIINIDRRFNNSQYGTINIVEKQASSISEIVFSIINYLKIEPDKDIVTNLYTGIIYATANFSSYSVNADTFDIASRLLRAGALKKPFVNKAQTQSPQSIMGQGTQILNQKPVSVNQAIPNDSYPTSEVDKIENLAPTPVPSTQQPSVPPQQTPSDWLKPKIFKGSSNLV